MCIVSDIYAIRTLEAQKSGKKIINNSAKQTSCWRVAIGSAAVETRHLGVFGVRGRVVGRRSRVSRRVIEKKR